MTAWKDGHHTQMKKQEEPIEKITVHYICEEMVEPIGQVLMNGTRMTNYLISKCLEDSEYELVVKNTNEFQTTEEVEEFLQEGDISWVDDTSLLQQLFSAGCDRPNIVGPKALSPVKNYNNGTLNTIYSLDWFYGGKVIRLNDNEERAGELKTEIDNKVDWVAKTDFIRHGIDLDVEVLGGEKKYILWAGEAGVPVKNFKFFNEVKHAIRMMGGLPDKYEFRQMSGYWLKDFYDVLEETRVYVCTSMKESFGIAVNEARARGVPTIVKPFLNGNYVGTKQPLQVGYTPVEFARKIREICLNDNLYHEESNKARDYVEDNCTLEQMRDDIVNVFDEVAYE